MTALLGSIHQIAICETFVQLKLWETREAQERGYKAYNIRGIRDQEDLSIQQGDLSIEDQLTTAVIICCQLCTCTIGQVKCIQSYVIFYLQSQVKGVVLLEQTPSSTQYLVEVQERLTIELGLTCIPVKSPACAAKIIKTMVSYRRALLRVMDFMNIQNAWKSKACHVQPSHTS